MRATMFYLFPPPGLPPSRYLTSTSNLRVRISCIGNQRPKHHTLKFRKITFGNSHFRFWPADSKSNSLTDSKSNGLTDGPPQVKWWRLDRYCSLWVSVNISTRVNHVSCTPLLGSCFNLASSSTLNKVTSSASCLYVVLWNNKDSNDFILINFVFCGKCGACRKLSTSNESFCRKTRGKILLNKLF